MSFTNLVDTEERIDTIWTGFEPPTTSKRMNNDASLNRAKLRVLFSADDFSKIDLKEMIGKLQMSTFGVN